MPRRVGDPISFDAVRERVAPSRPSVPVIEIPVLDLSAYDRLIRRMCRMTRAGTSFLM